MNVIIKALIKYVVDIIALALILFLSAGTIKYPAAWVLLVSVAVLGLVYGVYMVSFHKGLFMKRVTDVETRVVQLSVLCFSIVVLCGSLTAAGISFRFNFLMLPKWRYIISAFLFCTGAIIYYKVVNINNYLSTAVKVFEKQKVVSTGVYGVVRHPMYTSVMFMFLAAEFALGSVVALIISFLFFFAARARIQDEERVLSNYLDGYEEYMRKVKYRLIPYIW